jgi:hypothetical protein
MLSLVTGALSTARGRECCIQYRLVCVAAVFTTVGASYCAGGVAVHTLLERHLAVAASESLCATVDSCPEYSGVGRYVRCTAVVGYSFQRLLHCGAHLLLLVDVCSTPMMLSQPARARQRWRLRVGIVLTDVTARCARSRTGVAVCSRDASWWLAAVAVGTCNCWCEPAQHHPSAVVAVPLRQLSCIPMSCVAVCCAGLG